MLRNNTKGKPKSFCTLLRATRRWVGTILVRLFATTEQSPPATSKTWSRQPQKKKSRLPGWNEFQKALQDFQGPQPSSTSRKRKLKWETFKVIYFDPKNPGSFGGVQSLSKVADQPSKEWLSGQETYTLHRPVRRHLQRRRIIVSGIDDQ